MPRGRKLSEVKRYSDEKKWEDEVDWFQFPEEKMVLIRMYSDVIVMARHWVKTMSGKMFPSWCPRLDDEENFQHERPCPAHADFEDKAQKVIIANAIIRSLQERGDPNPVRGVMLPHIINDELVKIAQLVKADPADDERGVDLAITHSPKTPGNKKWSVQRGDKTPLTQEERRYSTFDFTRIPPDFSDPQVAEQYAKNMREAMARHKYYVVPDKRVPENARDPFKYFRGDARGQPWTEFGVLVDYRNAQKGDDAQSYRVSDRRRGDEELYEEEEARPARRRAAVDRRAAETSAQTTARPAAETQSDPADRADVQRPAETREDDAGRDSDRERSHSTGVDEKPKCYGDYHGGSECTGCGVRARCMDATEDAEQEM